MWTNVFKIGGLQHLSWFQYFPYEYDSNLSTDKSAKIGQKDAAYRLVMAAHLHLQNDGFISTWTNSFVGPWDPSQGIYNPDEKIKLWIFLPGHHSTMAEGAQAALSKLKVANTGQWSAPGDSEEIALALSQALRNCIGRALKGLSYVRFGDAFTRCTSSPQKEKYSRRPQPSFEFVFSANEEGIFVHTIVSAKHIRALSGDDIENVLMQKSSNGSGERLSAIVAPHGMQGRITGCCPDDVVKQVYASGVAVKSSAESSIFAMPSFATMSASCQLRGQSCYIEVTVGDSSPKLFSEKGTLSRMASDASPLTQRTFVYPPEAILVPLAHPAFCKPSFKRLWLQHWTGLSMWELWQLLNFPDSYSFLNGRWWQENNGKSKSSHNGSSNSNSSSISSISISSSDGDHGTTPGPGEFEADADSLTVKESGLSTNDEFDIGGQKVAPKRIRRIGAESSGQVGILQEAFKSDYRGFEGSNSAIVGEASHGYHWDWDDDEKGCIDIQSLVNEFGDFGDFFEDDILHFGEPPGTAESQAIPFAPSDISDFNASPCSAGMDVSESMFLPSLGVPQAESLSQPIPMLTEEVTSKLDEVGKDHLNPVCPATLVSSGEYNHLAKAEAVFTFAPEFNPVETPTSVLSAASFFKNPYLPKFHNVANALSSSKAYGAKPFPMEISTDKIVNNLTKFRSDHKAKELSSAQESNKYYKHVQGVCGQICDKEMAESHNITVSSKTDQLTLASDIELSSIVTGKSKCTVQKNLLHSNTVLATEFECIVFQASMCRLRHLPLSLNTVRSAAVKELNGYAILGMSPYEMNLKSEGRKKDSVPVRIAGDIENGILDGGPNNTPFGVWRSVGVTKGTKLGNSPVDSSVPVSYHVIKDEDIATFGQRQPLQELIDAIPFLVQHSSSMVDVFLDARSGDGQYGWLALQEQGRRGFSCGPSRVHAGCGGLLATSHSLDISGVQLHDPLSSEVHASSVISLLQSDIQAALRSAFGIMDGPLSVIDWCKGRNQSSDTLGIAADGYSYDSARSDSKDASSVGALGGDPMSPAQSSPLSSSCSKDGLRTDDRLAGTEMHCSESEKISQSWICPTVVALPFPSILVGYQDDWLKTSASSLQMWEKASFEPYASPKHMSYYVVCPDIDLLTIATVDFFQQLGTVYETCKLGTHLPLSTGGKTDSSSGKWSSSGIIHVDCPQSVKKSCGDGSFVCLFPDFLLTLSKGWDLKSYIDSLSKALKALKMGSNTGINQKETSNGSCMVIYVICPFPEPVAILRTIIESSAVLGSAIISSESRSLLYSQIGKNLSCSMALDETSVSNFLTLSGNSVPRTVLQIVSAEAVFGTYRSMVGKPALLKEIAFTVYNKARRVVRPSPCVMGYSPVASGKSQSSAIQMVSPVAGLWKDCVASRISGTSVEIDASMRSGAWDSAWQPSRTAGLSSDANRLGESFQQEEIGQMFEPLYILAEPGSIDNGVSLANLLSDPSGCRAVVDDGSEIDLPCSSNARTPSLHCCYEWTEDWRWLMCIWTDSRGELLESHVFPFGGISSRQDTKGLQSLFSQMLLKGCQILSCSPVGNVKPRDIFITRVGCFYELECQEWQKAIYSVGGSDVKKWPLHLRRSFLDGGNGNSSQQQEISLLQERALPSSPSPSLYSPQSKPSTFLKGGMGQAARKPLQPTGQTESSRGMFQWVQSISLIGVSVDHSLSLILPVDASSDGAGNQSPNRFSSPSYLESFSAVRSLGSTQGSYVLIPSPSIRYLPPSPLQLPTCLTAESPPLAHLLHSKGSAIPLSTGFVVSKAVPSAHNEITKDEWPSVISVSLVDYFGGFQEKAASRGNSKAVRNYEAEIHSVLETAAAELHHLSWMTMSPSVSERRTALPFHCDVVLKLRRLLYYADKEFCKQEKTIQT